MHLISLANKGCPGLHESCVWTCVGASIYDVHIIFGFPPSSLSAKSELFVRQFTVFLDTPSPPLRPSFMEAP